MGAYESLIVERHDWLALITVNRENALNSLNREVLLELEKALGACAKFDARALAITGAGKAFIAGADIASMAQMSVDEATEFSRLGHRVLSAIEHHPLPVVAAVNGWALGGGCEVALACDLIFASERAQFGQPEVGLGVIPGFGGSFRLSRAVGVQRARELIYSGRRINAEEAVVVGLAAKVVRGDELIPSCVAFAKELHGKGPLAITAAKRAILGTLGRPFGEASEIEAKAFGSLFATGDQREGMRAFLERRKPAFRGE